MHKHELTALRGWDVWLPPQFGRKSCSLIPAAPPVATLPCLVGSSFNNCYSKHTRKYRKRSISFKPLCLPRNLLVVLVLFNHMLQPPFRRGSTAAPCNKDGLSLFAFTIWGKVICLIHFFFFLLLRKQFWICHNIFSPLICFVKNMQQNQMQRCKGNEEKMFNSLLVRVSLIRKLHITFSTLRAWRNPFPLTTTWKVSEQIKKDI